MYSAVLPVQISLPAVSAPRTKRVEAIIDSGAGRCLFHANFAAAVGLDLKKGEREILNGIGGPEETWLHDITLHAFGGPISIRAGFKENLPLAALLGMNGFFEHFNVYFDGLEHTCTIDRVRIH